MGEAVIQRDERGRIVGLTMQAKAMSAPARTAVETLVRAVVESLTDYLHVSVQSSFADDLYVEIDRSDQHLDREIDAVLATMGRGLRIVEKEYPAELMVHDASIGVEIQA